jgi:hypothetical protein
MEILSSHTQVEAQELALENATKMVEDHALLGVKYCIQPGWWKKHGTISAI